MGDSDDADLGGNTTDTTASSGQEGQTSGDPINNTTGTLLQIETDYVGAGPFPLALRRTYNSQPPLAEALPGPFGANWSHSYSTHILIVSETSVQVVRADGKTLTFDLQPDGLWRSSPDVHSGTELVVDASDNLAGWRYTTGSDDVETYNATGKLLSITTRAGLTQALEYDGQERLATVTDPFGRTLVFAYNEGNRISSVTDPAGGTYSYEYDNDNLKSVTGPDGKTREYLYENSAFPHHLTGVIDENGVRFASFEYDGRGRATSSEHAGGADKVSMRYDADGDTHVTDALGTTRSYQYVDRFDVERTSRATKPSSDGGTATSTWTYDKNGNIKSYTDYRGNRTEFTYDLDRNLETSRTEAVGTPPERTITTEWHPSFRLPDKITQITEPTWAIDPEYDANGNLVQQTVTAGGKSRTWSFQYDDDGQITQIDGPRNDVKDITTYRYDGQVGNLQSVINAAGHPTTFTDYDPHGRPHTIEDPNGLITTLEYDERGRLKSEQVGSEETVYEYDAVGQLIELRLPDGRVFGFKYDGAHRLTEIADNLGNVITYKLDAMGNPTAEEVLNDQRHVVRTHSRTFDALNRLASSVGAEGQTTTFQYDDNDNLIQMSDPLGHSTSPWVYDELDRLQVSSDLNQAKIGYRYDANDQLTAVTDPVSLGTSYSYDGLGNLTSIDSPDTGLTEYAHDESGNVVSRTDARGEGAAYIYDELNRLKVILLPGGTPSTSFEYDQGTNGIGRLTRMAEETGTTEWTYDAHGRVLSKSQQVSGVADPFVTRYEYDESGRLKSIRYPSDRVVRFTYADGQITEISGLLSVIEYEPFGPPRAWIRADTDLGLYSRRFDLNGRVETYDLGGERTRTLDYDGAGRIEQYIDTDPTHDQGFAYDAAGRLIGFTINGATTSLGLDANGNRETLGNDDYTYDDNPPSNRLVGIAGSNPRTYDAAGNVLSDGVNQFEYDDGRGRLVGATNDRGSTQYLINGLGQRVAKLGQMNRYFVYDESGRLLGEYDRSPRVPVQEFVYLDDMLVAVLRREGSFFVYPDHLGTARAISEAATGNIVWRWDSDPFGATPPDEDPNRNGRPFTFNLRFPGQYFDQETGLFHNYFRDYDPQTGRYIEPDPIGLAGGINPYLYAEGNPLTFIDPYGLGATNGSASSSELPEPGLISEGLGPLEYLINPVRQLVRHGLSLAAAKIIARTAPVGAIEKAAVAEGITLFRVFGGEAGGLGHYWTTVDPGTVPNYREAAGLFPGNTGRFVAEGRLTSTEGVVFSPAAPGPGGIGGGLPQVVVPDPSTQVCLFCVSGVNPEF